MSRGTHLTRMTPALTALVHQGLLRMRPRTDGTLALAREEDSPVKAQVAVDPLTNRWWDLRREFPHEGFGYFALITYLDVPREAAAKALAGVGPVEDTQHDLLAGLRGGSGPSRATESTPEEP